MKKYSKWYSVGNYLPPESETNIQFKIITRKGMCEIYDGYFYKASAGANNFYTDDGICLTKQTTHWRRKK